MAALPRPLKVIAEALPVVIKTHPITSKAAAYLLSSRFLIAHPFIQLACARGIEISLLSCFGLLNPIPAAGRLRQSLLA